MVKVHKFRDREEGVPLMVADALTAYGKPPKVETFAIVNESARILLMIDEAHRTQSSDLGDNLFEAFPNATRIAFTGTPLITEQHGTKRTVKRLVNTSILINLWTRCATARRCKSFMKAARRTPR